MRGLRRSFVRVGGLSSGEGVHNDLVHPSPLEGFDHSTLDAAPFGIPVIAIRIPGLEEVVGDGGIRPDVQPIERWVGALHSHPGLDGPAIGSQSPRAGPCPRSRTILRSGSHTFEGL
jgi:glycosyltransferase involved in cell wall biosynthesis